MSNRRTKHKEKQGFQTDYIDTAVQFFLICQEIILCFTIYNENRSKPSFERTEKEDVIGNALLESCIINWCKLFGNQNDNELHICNVVKSFHYSRKDVMSKVYGDLKLTKKQHNLMQDTLLKWRNKVVAHLAYSDIIDESLSTDIFKYIPQYAIEGAKTIAKVLKEEHSLHPDIIFLFHNKSFNFEELSLEISKRINELLVL